MEEPVIAGETTEGEDSAMSLNEPSLMDEINIDSLEIPEAPDLEIPDLEMPDLDLSDLDLSDIVMPGNEPGMAEQTPQSEGIGTQLPAMSDAGEVFSLEDVEMPGADSELKLEDFEIPEMSAEEPFGGNDLSIDGLDQAIQSETELQMAGELNIDEFAFDNISAGIGDPGEEISDLALSDDGVPLPELSQLTPEPVDDEPKKKEKKAAKKKKSNKDDAVTDAEKPKEPGKLSKFFNLLTEEYVPEPTEEELAAEKEAKAAKKQENLTKKEEQKLAKEEAKKAKAEEKAAADRAKQEAAAQKKKEKLARKEAKKAKLAAEAPKKRIPPKKLAVAAAFGVSVGGAIVLASNILSTQGFLQTAQNAYYDGDYKTVYEATYGMELDDSESAGLIKARSEVIFKVQRRYDSYQTNIKMGREVEALDALLRGITAYDSVNADAEKYGVVSEVDAVKTNILNTLAEKYGLDESQARAIIANQDPLSYTIALNDVIAGN